MIHLVKLCVGVESIAQLERWQSERAARCRREGTDPRPCHSTRNMPRRSAEILEGGSLYWVVRHHIVLRQRIVEILAREDESGRRFATLVFDPQLVRIVPTPRRPFQGWRYLRPGDAPADLPELATGLAGLSQEMAEALDALGFR